MRVYADHIELWNEGTLPDGYTIETLLRKHSSRPRNLNIAEAFYRAGFIESWGRGIKKICDGFIVEGLPSPSFQENCGGLLVTIPRRILINGTLNGILNGTLNGTLNQTQSKTHNYSYSPIFINAEEYGKTHDQLYFEMKEKNLLGRRYFYPLISTFSTYRGLLSATPENHPVATKIANEVICLPMHHELSDGDLERILSLIVK